MTSNPNCCGVTLNTLELCGDIGAVSYADQQIVLFM